MTTNNVTTKIAIPSEAIGKQVRKRSKKPFKSGNTINTVFGVTVNPHSNRVAFTFYEDDSVVDVFQCRTL